MDAYILILPSWYPTPDFPLNGIFIKKHVEIIATLRPAMVLYASRNPKIQKRFEIETGDREWIVYFKPASIRALDNLLEFLAYWKGFRALMRRHDKPELIYNHVVYPAGLFGLFLRSFYRIPLIITEHWTGYLDADGRFETLPAWKKWLIRRTFRAAERVSAITAFLKNELARKQFFPAEKIFITPNVLFARDVPERSRRDSGIKILTISFLNDFQKNISGLIEAFGKAWMTHPELHLTIAGDGPDRKALEQLAEQLGLENAITFLGSVPNEKIPDLYVQHDFFVLNSNFETFSIATVEALLYGIPVVATRCGGPEEYVHGKNGVLVPSKDVASLSQAISFMSDHFREYDPAEMRQELLEKYSLENTRASLREFLMG